MAAKKRAVKKAEPKKVEQKQPIKRYYQIISHTESEALEALVEFQMDKGWKCAGGVAVTGKTLVQAMVKA